MGNGDGGADAGAACSEADVHWLLPINPAAHAQHQPADWRTRLDATAVWDAIGRSQPRERWCLSTGFRTMREGDVIWAYLAVRQEVCAVGRVRAVVDDGGWCVDVTWDERATRALGRRPVPRRLFGQVPMSTCRARAATVAVLRGALADALDAAPGRAAAGTDSRAFDTTPDTTPEAMPGTTPDTRFDRPARLGDDA